MNEWPKKIEKLCKGCGRIKKCWKSRSTYCKDCCKGHNREWERRNPARVRARTKRKAHAPAMRKHVSTYRKIKRRTDPEFRRREITKNRAAALKRKYNITPEQLEHLRATQDNRCAICGSHPIVERLGRTRDLAIDHDHATDRVRGLLCHFCNTALGLFDEHPHRLWRAICYLREHGRAWNETLTEALAATPGSP